MTRDDIDSVHIEHRSPARYWSITMNVVPKPGHCGRVPCYEELVDMAERILRDAKGLGKEWYAHNAEVMAWSSDGCRGILTPDRYRVTLDMFNEAMEDNADAD